MQQRDAKRSYLQRQFGGASFTVGGAAGERNEPSLPENDAGEIPISQIYLDRSHMLLDELQRLVAERAAAGF